jgi:glycosyltransferase involved in cell wall biosynthesis
MTPPQYGSTMPTPDVTVVIPVRAPAPYLAAALASVLDDPDAAEVVVVENGTQEVQQRDLGRARLIRLTEAGRSAARNAGVEAAETPFVAFLDADDRALPGRFARQREALAAAPDAGLTYGRVRIVDVGGNVVPEDDALLNARFDVLSAGPNDVESILETRCPIYTSATMVRRDSFREAGGYDVTLDWYEDLDLYLRFAESCGLVPTAGGPVSEHVRTGAQTTSDQLYTGMIAVAGKRLPHARGKTRRVLLDRRVEALWGLGRFADARRAALRAVVQEPRLAASPTFGRRLVGSLLPTRILEARR